MNIRQGGNIEKFGDSLSEKQMMQVIEVPISRPEKGKSEEQENSKNPRKIPNVAAYCRVSTNDEHQQSSYHLQVDYYTKLIHSHKDWNFYKVFADEGITGTSMKKRDQFNRMMKEAMEGKIDIIITKSISRFARNTVDALNCVRKLKQLKPPVGIYFEKENIDTLDEKSELILTILSALAQDESRSNSENVRWSLQKRFQQGIPFVNLSRMIGYELGENNEWIINEEQAETVQFIFSSYTSGLTGKEIARRLMEKGAKTGWGSSKWTTNGVYRILRNEKMVGDLLLQKTVTEDFLTHKSIPNDGRLQSYYVKDHHVGIIDRATWNEVQDEMERRRKATGTSKKKKQDTNSCENASSDHGQKQRIGSHSASKISAFASTLYCAACNEKLLRKTYTVKAQNYNKTLPEHLQSNKGEYYKFTYPVWQCNPIHNKCKNKSHELSIQEMVLEQSFMEMLYAIRKDYIENGEQSNIARKFAAAYNREASRQINNSISEKRIKLLQLQINDLMKKISKLTEPDTNERQELMGQLENRQLEYKRLERQLSRTFAMKRCYDWFIHSLQSLPETNYDGSPMVIFGIDTIEKNKAHAGKDTYNLLLYRDDIFKRIVIKAKIMDSGIAIFETPMLLELTAAGLDRSMSSFTGFRRAREDGIVEELTELYQIADRPVSLCRRRHT